MALENLEKIDLIPESEIVNDVAEPLKDNSLETGEVLNDPQENLEVLQSRLETTEIVTDLEMSEGIADYLETVEEIKFENWSKLSLEQKTEVLNRIEQYVAAIEHRPALKVELEPMKPRTLGYQSASEHKIALNSMYVASNNPGVHREVLDTIIHEGRHAYQHYNVDVKNIHESGAEVATWRENFYDPRYQYYHSTGQKIIIPYNDGSRHDVDFRLYYYQPVEIDARNFAKDVMSRLEEKGIIAKGVENRSELEASPQSNFHSSRTNEGISFKGNAGSHENLSRLPAPDVELTPETKAIIEFQRKMENNEIGVNDELLGTTEGYPVWDNIHDKFFKPTVIDDQIKVYKDSGTERLFVQTSTGFTAPLEKTNLWKPEGFSYSYQDALGVDVAVKTIGKM